MAIRLRQICLVAEKLAPVVDDLKAIFGLEVCFVDPAVKVFGLENSLFPVGNNFLEVVAPTQDNTAAGRYLKRRNGDGGYMVICQCDSHETQLARKARAAELGVRIALEEEEPGFHIMQLHPADTGGAFFEIDWDAKMEPEGHWAPAGGDWPAHRRTEIISGYAAVELQSPDPQSLAERWSSIAELPLRQDAQGRTEMSLDNVGVRFVEMGDDRGEGLAGLDLRVADRARLLRLARERGCRVSDEQVVVCGVRFNLV
ncbi:MAG: VOC family protein [Desulfurellaceae bacterium]|nr:VOC family protein [Desulfurellaceae bacterium]